MSGGNVYSYRYDMTGPRSGWREGGGGGVCKLAVSQKATSLHTNPCGWGQQDLQNHSDPHQQECDATRRSRLSQRRRE